MENNNSDIFNNKSSRKTSKKTKNNQKKEEKEVTIEKTKFDLEGKFLLVKVGSPESPALPEQIKDIENTLVGLLEKNNINCAVFVTHHNVYVELIETSK